MEFEGLSYIWSACSERAPSMPPTSGLVVGEVEGRTTLLADPVPHPHQGVLDDRQLILLATGITVIRSTSSGSTLPR